MSAKFLKAEKICSKYEIDALFEEGTGIKSGPLLMKLLLRETAEWPRTKYLVIVPKRRIKKAVDRNRIKRQLREVIRRNKEHVEALSNKRLLIAVVYSGQPKPRYEALQKHYFSLLKRIPSGINKF